jgi:hypothetical protein
MTDFLDRLNDPNDVKQAEYRAIYDTLMEGAGDGAEADRLDEAFAILTGFEDWVKAIRRLLSDHAVPEDYRWPVFYAVDEHDIPDAPWPVQADSWLWQAGNRWVATIASWHEDWWEGADPEDLAGRPDKWQRPIYDVPESGTLVFNDIDGNDSEIEAGSIRRPGCPPGPTPTAQWAVDIPNPHGDMTGEWENVGYYGTKAEAVKATQELFGADDEGRIGLISEITP